jgi:hypothetical protein
VTPEAGYGSPDISLDIPASDFYHKDHNEHKGMKV